MVKPINVLIFPCGAENAIEAYIALKDVLNINIFGASGKSDHGEYIFKNYISNVPYITDPSFIGAFNSMLVQHEIDVVIPTHDDVVLKLARHEHEIKSKVLIHGLKQAEICRSKKLTYVSFEDCQFCPKIFPSISSVTTFPVFAKPDIGQGGKGAMQINSDTIVTDEALSNYVICEYLPGEELTVDCFSDFNNELKFVGPRLRSRISNGISVRSSTIELTSEIRLIAEEINTRLKLNGLWYFQLKKDISGKYKLLEVSLRISGSMNLFRSKGINFPLLAIYNSLNFPVHILENKFQIEVDRALCNRYKIDFEFKHVYIDFDDTITKNGEVNPEVIMFLYNAKNNGKLLHLITKHEFDIYQTLESLHLRPTLFDSIHCLKKDQNKASYITNSSRAIFIDNAFSERKMVFENLGIPVFDVDAISALITTKN